MKFVIEVDDKQGEQIARGLVTGYRHTLAALEVLSRVQHQIRDDLWRIGRKLDGLIGKEDAMARTGRELLEAVKQQTTVINSFGAFVDGLKANLAERGIEQADIDAAFEGVTANTAAAAVFVNTPTPVPADIPAE
jgi:hypothetical protein